MAPLILVTNDDGVFSPGLTVLAEALGAVGEVFVVAPDRERSAVSHALTLHSPLRVKDIAERVFAVDGTPTDCVNLGIHGLLRQRPDLVISGINCGGNVGDDITYSGTVAAAMEATLMGVPALAFSLADGPFMAPDFHCAAGLATSLVGKALSTGLPANTFLNVNIPAGEPTEIRLTRQGRRRYEDLVVEKTDPRGRKYYWIGGNEILSEPEPGTDVAAIGQGQISVTPLHPDMTNVAAMKSIRKWDFGALNSLMWTEDSQ